MQRQFSVGGVVYKKFEIRNLKFEYKFLLRKGSFSPKYPGSAEWSLPKGWIDEAWGDKPGPKTLGKMRATKAEMQEAALREVAEEAGVRAKIIDRLGEVKFFFVNGEKEKVFKTVIFYLMEYVEEIPEGFGKETSEIRWVTVDEAPDLLKKRKGELEMILKALGEVKC